ncbi:MAG: chorismate mutase [Actinobacteria bacterium]|nr:chorismate mutase [Actinomycetota bacterium]
MSELDRFREEITEIDRLIFAAINRRLALVAELRRYKVEHGLAFLDPGREEAMVAERVAENGGPLSEEGLRTIHAELLALVKRELDAG